MKSSGTCRLQSNTSNMKRAQTDTPNAANHTRVFDLPMGKHAHLGDKGEHGEHAAISAAVSDGVPSDVFVDRDPCLEPLVLAILTATETTASDWIVPEGLQRLFGMNVEDVLERAAENEDLQIAVANARNIADKWQQVIGTGKPPTLRDQGDLCLIYRWAIDISWSAMGAVARGAQYDVPCNNGNVHPIYVKGIARATELQGVVALHFDTDNYTFILSGVPQPTPDVTDIIRRLHAGEGSELVVDGNDEVQLLPVEFVGCPEDSTQLMGLTDLLGLESKLRGYRVEAVGGNCAAAIDLNGIRAAAQGFAVVRYRSIFSINPPGRWNFHDEKGNQWLRLTVLHKGRVQFGIELGNAYHKACKE
jgi:hypothetical protein